MNNLDQLKKAIDDARSIKKILEKNYGAKKKAFDDQMIEGIADLLLTGVAPLLEGNRSSLLDLEKKQSEYADTIRDKFKELSKAALLNKLVKSTIDAEYSRKLAEYFHLQLEFHHNQSTQNLKKKIQSFKNKTAGREATYKNNNECLNECLIKILKAETNSKDLSKATFRRFCRLVEKKFPSPPFVQKLRQSKSEKSQDKEIQKADLEALERKEWAPTTLRTFFEKSLKVKIAELR